jgi:hypothetical protein
MRRSGSVVLVALALVAGSCSEGGSQGPASTTEPTQTPSTTEAGDSASLPTALAFAGAAVDMFDGSGVDAAVALLISLDLGYGLGQVVAAVFDGTLGDDGRITRDGVVVEPEGAASGLILGMSGTVAAAPVAFGEFLGWTLAELAEALGTIRERQEIEDARAAVAAVHAELAEAERAEQEKFADAAREATQILLIGTLAETGYSVEQIILAIVFDEWRCEPEGWAVEVMLAYGRNDPTSHRCGIPGEEPILRRQGVLDIAEPVDDGDGSTDGGGGASGSAIVAVGPIEIQDQDGQVTRNEFRFEACADGRFLADAVVEVVGDINSLYTMTGVGTWDASSGTGTAEVTEFISFVSEQYGESSNEVSGPASVTVTATVITVTSTEQSLTFPIVASAASSLCAGG